jgi:hypothetical protein
MAVLEYPDAVSISSMAWVSAGWIWFMSCSFTILIRLLNERKRINLSVSGVKTHH